MKCNYNQIFIVTETLSIDCNFLDSMELFPLILGKNRENDNVAHAELLKGLSNSIFQIKMDNTFGHGMWELIQHSAKKATVRFVMAILSHWLLLAS